MADDAFRLDKRFFSTTGLHDPSDETAFWLTKSPEERLAAVEYLRRMSYGDEATARLQRVFAVAQRQRR